MFLRKEKKNYIIRFYVRYRSHCNPHCISCLSDDPASVCMLKPDQYKSQKNQAVVFKFVEAWVLGFFKIHESQNFKVSDAKMCH